MTEIELLTSINEKIPVLLLTGQAIVETISFLIGTVSALILAVTWKG